MHGCVAICFCIMRTTITMQRHVMDQLKERAAESGASVSHLIEQSVRLFLRDPPSDRHEKPFELITFGAGGRFTKYNVDKAASLLEMEDLERFRMREE